MDLRLKNAIIIQCKNAIIVTTGVVVEAGVVRRFKKTLGQVHGLESFRGICKQMGLV